MVSGWLLIDTSVYRSQRNIKIGKSTENIITGLAECITQLYSKLHNYVPFKIIIAMKNISWVSLDFFLKSSQIVEKRPSVVWYDRHVFNAGTSSALINSSLINNICSCI